MPHLRGPLSALLLTALVVLLIGCPKHPIDPMVEAAQAMAGTWMDPGGCHFTIALQDDTPKMTSVVDADGEPFQIQSTGWRDGHFHGIYLVPSTGFLVDITILDQPGPDELHTEWKNPLDSGRESWSRIIEE